MKSIFWYILSEEESDQKQVIIYTTNYKKISLNIDSMVMAEYYNPKGDLVAKQYVVNLDSKEYKELVKVLKLTEKDRLVEKRTRKTK